MFAYSNSRTNAPGSAYPMEDSSSYGDSEHDWYDVYQQQRHDHYVALLEPILRGEVSTAGADEEEEFEELDDGGLSDAESDASYDEDTAEEDIVELGKRSRTDQASILSSAKRARVDIETEDDSESLTTQVASTSQSAAPLAADATRRAVILSTIPKAKRTRAHCVQFYNSLQLGPKQLQLLGQPGSSNRKNMTKQQREAYLNADVWITAGTVEPYKVTCAGCDNSIALEKPRTDAQKGNEFYASNWNKHRNSCGEVYRKWCERNGLVPDEGKGKPKEKKGAREVKAMPMRRRASLASIPMNVVS